MKNRLSLSVTKPCSERWEHFTPNSLGGFCSACHKNIIDFTPMSDEELLDFFKNSSAQSCGRFRPDQLRVYSTTTHSPVNSGWSFLQAGFFSLLMVLVSKQAYPKSIAEKAPTHLIQLPNHSQAHNSAKPGRTIKGTVRDEFKQPIPGVNVSLKGTTLGTVTDMDGNFTFPQELQAGDVLTFQFIGFVPKEYVVPKKGSSVVESASITLQMDLAIMGEVTIDSPYTDPPTGISKWWQKVKSVF